MKSADLEMQVKVKVYTKLFFSLEGNKLPSYVEYLSTGLNRLKPREYTVSLRKI